MFVTRGTRRETPCALMGIAGQHSRNDVGGQLVFDGGDLVFEGQFALFQPPDQQLIGRARNLQSHDLVVEFAVLRSQFDELLTEISFFAPLHVLFAVRPAARDIIIAST